jgi:deoxyribodipyrimidine photo-lyase
MFVPPSRVSLVRDLAPNPSGEYVLYWMIAARRVVSNHGLDRAMQWATDLAKPLVIFEPLRAGYPWASDRLHKFVLEGMAENRRRTANSNVFYYPYIEPSHGAGKGLLTALARRAAVVVTDDYPAFFLPRMVAAAGAQLDVRLESVDGNGLFPMRSTEQVFSTAYSFRRFLQKELPKHFDDCPTPDPLKQFSLPTRVELPREILKRWPLATDEQLRADRHALSALPIDHAVGPAAFTGGSAAAEHALLRFLDNRLARYGEERNDPDADAASGLSPYLHFGHIGVHQILAAVSAREEWSPSHVAEKANGSREGWWRMTPAAEGFLDELITWRELGFNFCSHREDYDQFDSLPDWAKATLTKHAADRRTQIYSLDAFEQARTHDELWNAAQRQLTREGRMQNYLRMLWGKKILEWSATPQDALATMIELNNKYAVDGRDPNSYTGICWVLGRYDRPWAPERPIFGVIRYMSSDNTRRKLNVKEYLRRYGPTSDTQGELF